MYNMKKRAANKTIYMYILREWVVIVLDGKLYRTFDGLKFRESLNSQGFPIRLLCQSEALGMR